MSVKCVSVCVGKKKVCPTVHDHVSCLRPSEREGLEHNCYPGFWDAIEWNKNMPARDPPPDKEGSLHDASVRCETFHEFTGYDGAKYKLPWPVNGILSVERDIYPMTTLGFRETVGQVELEDLTGEPQETVKVRFWTGETLMMKWEDLKLVGRRASTTLVATSRSRRGARRALV